MACFIPPEGEILTIAPPPPGTDFNEWFASFLASSYTWLPDEVTMMGLPPLTSNGGRWWVAVGWTATSSPPGYPNRRAAQWITTQAGLEVSEVQGPAVFLSAEEVRLWKGEPAPAPPLPARKSQAAESYVSERYPGWRAVPGNCHPVRGQLRQMGARFDPAGVGYWMVPPGDYNKAVAIVEGRA